MAEPAGMAFADRQFAPSWTCMPLGLLSNSLIADDWHWFLRSGSMSFSGRQGASTPWSPGFLVHCEPCSCRISSILIWSILVNINGSLILSAVNSATSVVKQGYTPDLCLGRSLGYIRNLVM